VLCWGLGLVFNDIDHIMCLTNLSLSNMIDLNSHAPQDDDSTRILKHAGSDES